MAYFLINGASGTGKTTYFADKINELRIKGEKGVLIIPEQISLISENKIIEKTGYLGRGIDVLSFGRLFYKIYKLTLGRKREYVSNVGKTIIVNRILSKNANNLKIYKSSSKTSLMTGRINATISEFKRHSVTLSEIKEACEKIKEGSASLKLQDLSLIFEEYEKEIAKFGYDADDNITLLSSLIKDCDYVKNTTFFVDSFSSFTSAELNVLKELKTYAKDLYISLNCDNSQNLVFSPVYATKRQLEEILGKPQNITDLTENKKHGKELLFLERNYARFSKNTYCEPTEDISVFISESPYEEVDMCARDIVKKTKEGLRFSDIGIVCTNPDYESIIENSFKKHDIKYYMNTQKNMLMHPVCLLFLSLFDIFISSFSYEAVFTFLKTGFIDVEDIELLENYVLDTGIKGSRWQEEFTFKGDKYDLIKINKAREAFLSVVMPFRIQTKGKTKCDEYIYALKAFCENINLENKITKIVNSLSSCGRLKDSMEYKKVYECFMQILDQLSISMEEEAFGVEKLSDMMKSAFSESKLSTLPTTSDEVLCAGADEIRHHDFKILYIIGATDQTFPSIPSGTGLLTDGERRLLRENEIELAPDLKRIALEQPFKIYEILTIPTNKLIISYPLSDISRVSTRPSSVISEIKTLFPYVAEKSSMGKADEDFISTARATIDKMIENEGNPLFDQAKKWYLENEKWSRKVKYLLSAKKHSPFSSISEETAEKLWGKRLHATVSRLEAFAECPFKFFARYGLELYPRDKQEIGAPDAGTFMHAVMEDYTSYVTENDISWYKITKEECIKKAYELSEKSLRTILEKTPLLTKRHEFLIEKMKKSAADTLWAVVKQIQAGSFTPYAAELNIGKSEEIIPLNLKTKKGDITLYGVIDRVDRFDNSYRIIDYKSGKKDLDLSKVEQGISLQLFVYSNALKDSFGKSKGMFYLTINSPLIEFCEGMTLDTIEQKVIESFSLKGYMVGDENTPLEMDRFMEEKSFVVPAKRTKKGISSNRILSPEKYDEISEKMFEKIKTYTDEIIEGKTSVSPFTDGKTTSCDYCDFASVCGFEKSTGCFRKLEKGE